MSMQDPNLNPNEMHIQPPKEGISSGMRTLIIVCSILGVMALFCCGGIVGIGVYMTSYFSNAISDDPAVIAQRTAQFVEIEIPSELTPLMSLDMPIPLSDESLMVFVVYTDQPSNTTLTMASLGSIMAQDEAGARRQIEQSMRQQGIVAGEGVDEWVGSVKEIEIRGETVEFNFSVGTNTDTETKRIKVTGMFEGKSGPVILDLNADAEVIDEEGAVKMLESIK